MHPAATATTYIHRQFERISPLARLLIMLAHIIPDLLLFLLRSPPPKEPLITLIPPFSVIIPLAPIVTLVFQVHRLRRLSETASIPGGHAGELGEQELDGTPVQISRGRIKAREVEEAELEDFEEPAAMQTQRRDSFLFRRWMGVDGQVWAERRESGRDGGRGMDFGSVGGVRVLCVYVSGH